MIQDANILEIALHALFFCFVIAPAFVASLVAVERLNLKGKQ